MRIHAKIVPPVPHVDLRISLNNKVHLTSPATLWMPRECVVHEAAAPVVGQSASGQQVAIDSFCFAHVHGLTFGIFITAADLIDALQSEADINASWMRFQ